jgi:damage-control phosphatase, subfamily I
MKADLECLNCMLKQALNSVNIATDDNLLKRKVLDRVSAMIPQTDLNQTPAEISKPVYRIVAEVTGNADPYKKIKEETNREALNLLPELEEVLNRSPKRLETALHLAVAGNIVDIGIGHAFELRKDVLALLDIPFAVDDSALFEKELIAERNLLYLGDNSGEIVFDRLLIETLLPYHLRITYCVKSAPIINDALMEDARTTGITDLVPVIETGADDIGINLGRCSPAFKKALAEADVVVAKGHGNFETCNDLPGNFYFLLKAKCAVVARELGVPLGAIVFKKKAQRPSVGGQ